MDYFSTVLISLTHFCDKHGPRIICVTQCSNSSITSNISNIYNTTTNNNIDEKQSDNDTFISNNQDNDNDKSEIKSISNSVKDVFNVTGGEELLVPNYPIDSYCDSCLLWFPPNPASTDSSDPEINDAIRSMRSILNNHAFVTTQYSSIRFQKLNSITRKVFSEETMIYDCSPFVFYDDIRGLNLSMGFKLYDENARGNERRYCLILTIDQPNIEFAMDLLSQNWNFILLGFKKIINHIKELHQIVIDGLNREKLSKNKLGITNSSNNKNSNNNNNNNNLFISNYLRANKTKIAKNLITLTNDKSIFIKIHKWNAYLISSLINKNRLTSINNINIGVDTNNNNGNNLIS